MPLKIDEVFKSKMDAFTRTPSDGIWLAIEKELTLKPTAPQALWGKFISVLSILSLAGILFSIIQLGSSKPKNLSINPKNPTSNTPRVAFPHQAPQVPLAKAGHAHLRNPSAASSIIRASLKGPNPTQTPTPTPNVRPKTDQLPRPSAGLSAKPTALDSAAPSLMNSQTSSTSQSPKEIKKADHQYQMGDYVVFRIAFENTSTKTTNQLQIWEEFPDWCDASTLETIGHDPLHHVKTKIKKGQNTVIWKVKGDFVGPRASSPNKGYIEYRIQLTEAIRASELKRNEPQSK